MNDLELKGKRATVIVKTLKSLFPQTKSALNYSTPWEFLVAVILSAQCTDARVNIVTEKLFKKYPTIESYAKANITEFEQDIKSTGFYKNKAKNVLATAKIVHEKYHDSIPQTMEEMMTLPGVARKTANVVLGNAFGIVEGVAVDTHVRRLSNVYGLTNESDPEKIEKDLTAILPKAEWTEFTLRMIDYGRKYCPAKKHDHEQCPLVIALREERIYPQE
ncbi:endonuclease III [Candidatus Roizmanbacteria bacterium]|nr:MAG: endonuclease III [Candidatus Roizmanbacteria bacterium]